MVVFIYECSFGIKVKGVFWFDFWKEKMVKVKGFFIKIIVIIIEELVYGELYIVVLKWMVFFMWLMLKNENCERNL